MDEWGPGRIESGRLDELHREAEELYVEASLRTGHSEKVLARAQTLTREQPLRERRWALLALAQYQAGQQNEALSTLRRVRKVFNRDLGLDPGPELAELEQAMLRQDPTLFEHPPLPEPSAVCPYRGLLPYDTDNADTFFGRADDVGACLQQLSATRVLAVVGPSGSGKSSMVRAGVVAALRRDGRDVLVITPGRHPAEALALLPRRRAASTLVVDQCEEVYSLCQDLPERERFLDALVEQAAAGSLVVVLRADHLADVSAHRGFAGVVERGLHLIAAMREDELRAAIVEPARLAGLDVEPALVQILVQEVSGNPGALPMLSHALQETWARREGRTLTVAGYEASGGIREAVARSAEEVYSGVATEQQPMLRALLLRLVAPAPRVIPCRAGCPDGWSSPILPRTRWSTCSSGHVWSPATTASWSSPTKHSPGNGPGCAIGSRRTSRARGSCTTSQRRPTRGTPSAGRTASSTGVCGWPRHSTGAPEPPPVSAAWNGSSWKPARISPRLSFAARRTKPAARRTSTVACAVCSQWPLSCFWSRPLSASTQCARPARPRRPLTLRNMPPWPSRPVASAPSHLAPDLSESLLLAVQGVRLDDSPETRVNLLAAMAREPHLVRSVPAAGDYLSPMTVSTDGERIAAPDDDGAVHLYDAATGGLLRSYDTLAGESPGQQVFAAVSFSPRDEYLAVGATVAPSARLLDPHTLAPTGPALEMPGGDSRTRVTDLDFSADGRYLAAARQRRPAGAEAVWSDPSSVAVWDLRHLDRPPHVMRTEAGTQGIVLSPDGRTVYTSLPLTAYDVATGRTVWATKHESWLVLDVSPDGKLLASEIHDDESSSSKSGPIRLTDARTGETQRILRGHEDQPFDIRFSSDGRRLASVSTAGELIVWNVSTGKPLVTTDTSEGSFSVSFSPDGHRVYTGGDAGLLRTWDLYGDQQFLRRTDALPGAQHFVEVSASPDGTRLAFHARQVRDLDHVPRHDHGEERLRQIPRRDFRSAVVGRGVASRWSALCRLRRVRRGHRAGCPDRAAASAPAPGQPVDQLDGLRRQGRTAARRGRRRPRVVPRRRDPATERSRFCRRCALLCRGRP